MEFDYKRDNKWQDYLIPESKQHGARFSVPLLLDLINMYSKEGDDLLDPMGGAGSIFVALTLKRNAYAVELEPPFAIIAEANRQNIRTLYPEAAKMASWVLQGDSRFTLPIPIPIDLIITSPPYGDAMRKADPSEQRIVEYFGSTTAQGYGETKGQIGNLPYPEQHYEMKKIYRGCWSQLNNNGLLIVITKDIIKGGKRVELGRGTMQNCMESGFELAEYHTRKCQQTGMQNLHLKEVGYKPITYEDVFVFRKLDANKLVDNVLIKPVLVPA